MKTIPPIAFAVLLTIFFPPPASAESPTIAFDSGDGHLAIAINGQQIAVYYYVDPTITRPYFAHVRTLDGQQLTRNYPPVTGQDLMDHPTYHPGLGMMFGNISGFDYWRLAAKVRHAKFIDDPKSDSEQASFAVQNEFLNPNDPSSIVCRETAHYKIHPRSNGYLLLWDSTFSSDKEFYFGDQAEMGLGFRVATPLRVGASGKEKLPAGQGTILDSHGRTNEKAIWGQSADWCDFSGPIGGRHAGMTIFCHPDNFRPSWFHARDYGLLVANPFGRHEFRQGDVSKVVVKPGEDFRLRYGVLIHSDPPDNKPDLATEYHHYLKLTGK